MAATAEDRQVELRRRLPGGYQLFWTRACEGRPVRLDVRGQAGLLPDSHLLSLAIITHELISNACRHAFPNDRRGSVAVAFSRAVGGVSLVVRDTGVGAATLVPGEGLTLVQGLVEHLGGAMSIETAPEAASACASVCRWKPPGPTELSAPERTPAG